MGDEENIIFPLGTGRGRPDAVKADAGPDSTQTWRKTMRTSRLVASVVFILGALALLPGNGEAQSIMLGVKGGANFSDIADLSSDIGTSGNTDLVAGLYAQLGWGKWALQPEVLFSARSVGLSGDTEGAESLSLTYLEIPVLVDYRLMTGIFEPSVFTGVSASFQTSCELDAEDDVYDCEEWDLPTESALWAWVVGAAIDFDLGPLILGVDGRYNYGFTEIASEEDDGGKWRYFSLMAQLGIAIGR